METFHCHLKDQGKVPGKCLVEIRGERKPACQVTLKTENGIPHRLITSIHLSRPENYLSVYQSGCNLSCRKCHSWHFSKQADGKWYSPEDILQQAIAYEKHVTLPEPREKATAWHAHDTCRCCGSCVVHGVGSALCPGQIEPDSITLSPQGFGPVRNIIGFTGGDLTCCPDFYRKCAQLIKQYTRLWVLIETNGYGLTPKNLDVLKESGIDAFWLDIKAYDSQTHNRLTGCDNTEILKLPQEMMKRGFTLEVLSLYIPDFVETPDLDQIARTLYSVDRSIPFTILAFFPEYRMKNYRSPTVQEMVEAYQCVKRIGLENVRLGNIGVFAGSEENMRYLAENVESGGY